MTTREFKQWQEKSKVSTFGSGHLQLYLTQKSLYSIKNPSTYQIDRLYGIGYNCFNFHFSKGELTITDKGFKLKSKHDIVTVHYKNIMSLYVNLNQTFK